MIRFARVSTFALLILSVSAFSQTSPARGHFDHATVLYDWVTNSHGEKLRTFVTRPNTIPNDSHGSDSAKKVPVIFFVGWLSCDSMEYPDANTRDGFGIFIRRLIDESGYATVRMDKPGAAKAREIAPRPISRARWKDGKLLSMRCRNTTSSIWSVCS